MLFDKMDGIALSVFATAFAISISKGLTKEEIALLSLFLSSVSSTLALIEGQLPVLEELKEDDAREEAKDADAKTTEAEDENGRAEKAEKSGETVKNKNAAANKDKKNNGVSDETQADDP